MIPHHPISRAAFLAAAAASALSISACSPEDGGTGGPDTALETRDMPVRPVNWNPDATEVGQVKAVIERGPTTAVFADTGANLFSGGVFTGKDSGVTTVGTAAVIPAADQNGLWVAGADAEGKVWRLVAESSFEVVSGLYGLAADDVTGLGALGDGGTAFAIPGGLALSDGTTVTRYDTGALAGIAAGGGRVAGITEQGVSLFDPATTDLVAFDLPGATAVAFDDTGRLLALVPGALYREATDGTLVVIYRSPGAALAGLAAAPGRVWFGDGSIVGLVDEAGVALSPDGSLPDAATLTASPTGDVWAIADGTLSRLAVDIGTEDGRQTWEADMEPIFTKSCTPCHLPGGSAPVVLSTYDAWVNRKDKLQERVIDKKDMPPQGFVLTDEDRAAIGAWLGAQ